jgi:hypothetical protein
MSEYSDQDYNLSFMFINYLNSGYQASYAALSFLKEMDSSTYHDQQLQFTLDRLQYIASWLDMLTKGEPFLIASWRSPQTKEAREGFSTVESLKREIIYWINEVHRILGSKSYSYALEDTKILLAQLARCTYGKAYFLRGMREFAKIMHSDEMSHDIEKALPTAQKELETVHSLIDTIKITPNLQTEFFQTLTFHSYDVPTKLYTQVHDLNLLLSTYDQMFTYERAGIGLEEGEQWQRIGIIPVEASLWRAHGIGPAETALWKQLNFLNPANAAGWKKYGFPPEEAIQWITRGFPPALARRWKDSGYSPEQAQKKIAEQQSAKREEPSGSPR